MEVNLTETNKGAKSLICDGFRYRVDKVLKSKEISWSFKLQRTLR